MFVNSFNSDQSDHLHTELAATSGTSETSARPGNSYTEPANSFSNGTFSLVLLWQFARRGRMPEQHSRIAICQRKPEILPETPAPAALGSVDNLSDKMTAKALATADAVVPKSGDTSARGDSEFIPDASESEPAHHNSEHHAAVGQASYNSSTP
jgi:hypothetical protein